MRMHQWHQLWDLWWSFHRAHNLLQVWFLNQSQEHLRPQPTKVLASKFKSSYWSFFSSSQKFWILFEEVWLLDSNCLFKTHPEQPSSFSWFPERNYHLLFCLVPLLRQMEKTFFWMWWHYIVDHAYLWFVGILSSNLQTHHYNIRQLWFPTSYLKWWMSFSSCHQQDRPWSLHVVITIDPSGTCGKPEKWIHQYQQPV